MSSYPLSLIAIDKQGKQILFVDPTTYLVTKTLSGFPATPHELIMLAGDKKAYVPIYGDGIHGDNPHPQHFIAVIDLQRQMLQQLIDIAPLTAPHTGYQSRDGKVYLCCEDSGKVAVLDPDIDQVIETFAIPSTNSHRLAVSPLGDWLYTENEEDETVTAVDLRLATRGATRTLTLPHPLSGITHSPTAPYLVLSAADTQQLLVFDTERWDWLPNIDLTHHQHPCQVVRYHPNGRLLVAIGDQEPRISLFNDQWQLIASLEVGEKPMDATFSPDGKTLIVANEGSATWSVIDLTRLQVIATPQVGVGCETLSYFELKRAIES